MPTNISRNVLPSHLVSDELYTDILPLWPSLWVILCSIGLLTNALIIRTFLRMGLDESVTISFFTLALSDFAHVFFPLIMAALYTIVYVEAKFSIQIDLQRLVIVYVTNIMITFNNLTAFITTFLAVQRCMCIVRPLQVRGMFTVSRTWRIMGALFIIAIVPFISYAGVYDTQMMQLSNNETEYILTVKPAFRYVDAYVGTTFFLILPVTSQTLVLGSVVVMAYALTASAKFRRTATKVNEKVSQVEESDIGQGKEPQQDNFQEKERSNFNSNSKERTAIVQVEILSAIFLVSSIPKITLALATVLVPDLVYRLDYVNLYKVFLAIRYTFDISNSCLNVFIYYKFNTRFRNRCFGTKK